VVDDRRKRSSVFHNERAGRYGGELKPNPFERMELPELRDKFSRPYARPEFIQIGSQWYRQEDDGRANKLVPVLYPGATKEDVEAAKAAFARAAYIAGHPLAAVVDVGGMAFGASPETRDKAVYAVGSVEDVAHSIAPAGVRTPKPMRPPAAKPPQSFESRKDRIYGPATATGQATGVDAVVTGSMIGSGKPVRKSLQLRGAERGNYQRGHLMARVLGGAADEPREAVLLSPWANKQMYNSFEREVKRRAQGGEAVYFRAVPSYDSPDQAPSSISLFGSSSSGELKPKIIFNPPARRKK